MALNLVQHRGDTNVWDRRAPWVEWDPERWVTAVGAGTCLIYAFRARTTAGWLLALGGVSLAWWAAAGRDERQQRRDTLRLVWPIGRARQDLVEEASLESFPASDAPSWTATAGNGGTDARNCDRTT